MESRTESETECQHQPVSENAPSGKIEEEPNWTSKDLTKQSAQDERKRARIEMLEHGDIAQTLWKLTFPALIAMLVNATYSVADASIIGHLVGEEGLAAVSIASTLEQGLVNALSLLIGSGVAPLYSASLGERDHERCKRLIANSFILALIFAILLVLLTPFATWFMYMFGGSDETGTLEPASDYIKVLMFGSFIWFCGNITNNILRAEGMAARSAINIGSSAIINAALDPFWIWLWGGDVAGAGFSTVFSKAVNAVLGFEPYLNRKTQVTPSWRHFKPQPSLWKEIILQGFGGGAMNLAQAVVIYAVNKLIIYHTPGGQDSTVTTTLIAAYICNTRIIMIAGMVSYSLQMGSLPILGVAFGRSKTDPSFKYRFRAVLRLAIRWGYNFGLLSLVGLYLGAPLFGLLFSTEDDFLNAFTFFLKVSAFGSFIICPTFQLFGAFMATKQGGTAAVLMLSRSLVLVIPCYLLFSAWLGTDGLPIGYSVSEWLNIIVSSLIVFKKRESLFLKDKLKYLFVPEKQDTTTIV